MISERFVTVTLSDRWKDCLTAPYALQIWSLRPKNKDSENEAGAKLRDSILTYPGISLHRQTAPSIHTIKAWMISTSSELGGEEKTALSLFRYQLKLLGCKEKIICFSFLQGSYMLRITWMHHSDKMLLHIVTYTRRYIWWRIGRHEVALG